MIEQDFVVRFRDQARGLIGGISNCLEREDVVQLRIAAVDLVSNTCFPALAAEELGFYKAEGLDAHIELVPMLGATKALRSGKADAMIAGSVHDVLTEFPRWEGAKLVVALSQGTPWLLVVRADLAVKRGDLSAVKGLRLTAAEGPDLALRQMLIDANDRSGREICESWNCRAPRHAMSPSGFLLPVQWRKVRSMAFGPTLWVGKLRSGGE